MIVKLIHQSTRKMQAMRSPASKRKTVLMNLIGLTESE
ncbi:hypothetical protein AVDCRST_MAG92-4213 [uncultured Coleofasciculus sp.]|uniref:Uncharacterized protein n=1 Tax=uncultured Coleofasciculus sp. TaxID=1267456 RepID=A0A6J4JWK4_9CYAN|nr:hypothetical protein AVDCRST_MAG92-4213 [uncultured Coleofasciculus sp.]